MDRDLAGPVIRRDPGDRLCLAGRVCRPADDDRRDERSRAAPRDMNRPLDRADEARRLDRLAVGILQARAQRDGVGPAAIRDLRQSGRQTGNDDRAPLTLSVGVRRQPGIDEPVDLGPLDGIVLAGVQRLRERALDQRDRRGGAGPRRSVCRGRAVIAPTTASAGHGHRDRATDQQHRAPPAQPFHRKVPQLRTRTRRAPPRQHKPYACRLRSASGSRSERVNAYGRSDADVTARTSSSATRSISSSSPIVART